MKNYFVKTLLIIQILFTGHICHGSAMIKPGLKKIIDRGELIISFTPNDATMFTVVDENKNITGIDMEIAELIANELRVKAKILTSAEDWNAVVQEVGSGKADIGISFLSITTERSKLVDYSQPYVQIRQNIFFNNLSVAEQRKKGYKIIKDMFTNPEGLKLAVYEGSSYVDFANHLFPGVKVRGYHTIQEMINAVLKREVDAILNDELELSDVIRKEPGLRLKLTQVILKDQPDLIAIVVNPNNKDLLDFVNNVLKLRQINYSVDSAFTHTLELEKRKKWNEMMEKQ